VEAKNKVELRNEYSITIIPDYIYHYLTKKVSGGDQLLNDLTIDQYLSVDDIATLIFLNNPFFLKVQKYGLNLGFNSSIDYLSKTRLSGQGPLDSKIKTALTWSYSDKIKEDTYNSLYGILDETNPSYEFIVTGPKIWLNVKSGFFTMLENPITRLNFYRDYLKTVEKTVLFACAANTDVFSYYVKEIVG